MQFVDEALIEAEAGNGGDGCLSFHRARNLPKGGPDGGNGGNGGDVRLIGDAALNTLVDFRFQRRCRAANGRPGGSRERTGANGEALLVPVPVGTSIVDEETRTTIGEVRQSGETCLVARGGQRGFGNAHFKSSTNRAPRRTTPGKPGERRRLRLALQVIADVGLLGMPNAGKSTLISRASASRPKIADYPFTTLIPNLGVVRVGQDASFVMADVPGLIPGAAAGAGLGFRFLKHLSRTRLLLHLVDASPIDGRDPVAEAKGIEDELFAYSAAFRDRPIWMVATKMDVTGADSVAERLRAAFADRPWHAISAATGQGVDALLGAAMAHVSSHRERLAADAKFAAREADSARRMGADVLEHTYRPNQTGTRRRRPELPDRRAAGVEVVYRRD